MFERFTEKAKQVVVCAQDESRLLKHNYIGTEHILLGLLRMRDGLAARVLKDLGMTLEDSRNKLRAIIPEGDQVKLGQIPFTPRGKKILELSLREALALGHNYIGTEHILLGLVRESEGVAARMLQDEEITAELVRQRVVHALMNDPDPPPPSFAGAPEVYRRAANEILLALSIVAACPHDETCNCKAKMAEITRIAMKAR